MKQTRQLRVSVLFALVVLPGIPWAHAQRNDASKSTKLTFHGKPANLHPEAVTEPWPHFLGRGLNSKSRETHILKQWPETGPKLVWELEQGTGYASPAISGGNLVLFHRLGDEEVVQCLDPETGRQRWEMRSPVEYTDRFGYSNGPRASPVIDGTRVYTRGIRSMVHCCDLESGNVLWKRNLGEEYSVPQNFFGNGATPLVLGDKLIFNLGGKKDNECVAALDKMTGKTLWIARDPWGVSYASPIPFNFGETTGVLVFAGGESDPPAGGLVLLDAANGKIFDRFPWRADKVFSVNAASPVVVENRVFITESYRVGGVMLEVGADGKFKEKWKAPRFASHWLTPVYHEGHLYGFDGEKQPLAELVCYAWDTGKELWREDLRWEEDIDGRKMVNGVFRGSLLWVDGRFLCLGESGALLWLDLSPQGCRILQRQTLFRAPETWTTPAIHRGLVYVSQHYRDFSAKTKPRLLCYEFRASEGDE